MKTWQSKAPLPTGFPPFKEFFTESALFLDIETTGLSPAHSQIYLIGCACQKEGSLWVTQFFSECPQEEPDILSAFLGYLLPFDTVITYNGQSFDLPFLAARCACHCIPEPFQTLRHIDLFRQLSRYRHILKLPDMKQKTLEHFLGICREDTYTGKELIQLYNAYAASAAQTGAEPPTEKASLLKLHNYEDILGMANLLPALAYGRLFEGDFHATPPSQNIYAGYNGSQAMEWILPLRLDSPLPMRFSFGKPPVYLTGFGSNAKLAVKAFQGELKYFYPNPKEYYYLPAEDTAIHKSVGSYVDKNYRTQATAATCYTRKAGCFLPQYRQLFRPCFQTGFRSKATYFELAAPFAGSPESWEAYARHLLQWLLE